MDLNKIIRDMIGKGMSEQQVKDNLRELGVEDADGVFAKATERMHEMASPPVRREPTAPVGKKPDSMKEFSFSDEGGREHDLFSESPAGAEEPKEREPAQPLPAKRLEPVEDADKPGFSFTSVSDEGEREVRVGEKANAEPAVEKADELMRSVAETSLGDLDAVERKLDDTLALLKALKDVNEKILQAQRDVLLRLK